MLTRKELEAIFCMYLDVAPFEDSEIAKIEASKIAEEGYERLSLQLEEKLDGRRGKLFDDMLSYQASMEMYRNIHYLWQGYLLGMKKRDLEGDIEKFS